MDASTILEGINEKAAAVPPLGNTLKIDFEAFQAYIDGTGESNVVSNTDADADCVISISPENFIAMVKGDLNPMMAMMSGKIKIKGDMGVAMKLQSLLS